MNESHINLICFLILFWLQAEGMNAFKAYKACVPIAWSPNLYITLVRGIPGTRRLHRRTLEALRLRKCNRTVMRWNTPTVRGMLQQVLAQDLPTSIFCLKGLVSVDTNIAKHCN